MASSSGNSSGSTQIHGSDDGLTDQRKRKRMQSNRESARRSRMRKQQHLDELLAQVTQLKKDNAQIAKSIEVTVDRFVEVEGDNSVLRAQVSELSQRLDSLNQIINCINMNLSPVTTNSGPVTDEFGFMESPWMYLNQQPAMAVDMYGY